MARCPESYQRESGADCLIGGLHVHSFTGPCAVLTPSEVAFPVLEDWPAPHQQNLQSGPGPHCVAPAGCVAGLLKHEKRFPGAPIQSSDILRSAQVRNSAINTARPVSEGGSKPGEPHRLSAPLCESGEWWVLPELIVLSSSFKTCCHAAQPTRKGPFGLSQLFTKGEASRMLGPRVPGRS